MTTFFERIIIDSNAKLIINKDIYDIIQKLHLKYPNKEWSGLFSWNIISGGLSTIEDINNLVIKVDAIYPLSVGSSAAVYYKLNSEVLQLFAKNNINPLDKKFGTIHTHHSMGAFFSNVDENDLFESSKGYINYISLVVDTKDTYKACISKNISETTKTYNVKFKNSLTDSTKDSIIKINNKVNEALLMINLKVIIEDLNYPDYLNSFIKDINNIVDTDFHKEYNYKEYNSFNTNKISNFNNSVKNYNIIAKELYCKLFNIETSLPENIVIYDDMFIDSKFLTNLKKIITKELPKLLEKYKFEDYLVKEYFKNSKGKIGIEIYKALNNKKQK